MSFLSSLVSSPSAAKAAAKNLWPTGLSPPAEAKLQSTMADGEFGLFPRCVSAAKGKVRNTRRIHAPLPPAASRLRAAQRGFGPKMAAATETGVCKSHKPRSARNYRVRKNFPPHCPCKSHKPRYRPNPRDFIRLRESITACPR